MLCIHCYIPSITKKKQRKMGQKFKNNEKGKGKAHKFVSSNLRSENWITQHSAWKVMCHWNLESLLQAQSLVLIGSGQSTGKGEVTPNRVCQVPWPFLLVKMEQMRKIKEIIFYLVKNNTGWSLIYRHRDGSIFCTIGPKIK